jgi:hypothetical protein
MRKTYSIRLKLTEAEGQEVHRMALAQGRSQTDVLTRLVKDGFRYQRGDQSEIGKLAHLIRTGVADTDAA